MKNKITHLLTSSLLLIGVLVSSSFGRDESDISFSAGTFDSAGAFSDQTGVHFIVTDPMGRRMGNDGTLANEAPLREIPGSGYGVDSMGDEEIGTGGPESVNAGIRPVMVGTYTITLYGLATIKFYLDVGTMDTLGNYHPNRLPIIKGFITAGTTAQYVIVFDPAPGKGVLQLVKRVTFESLRQDIQTAFQLGQLGDDKFVNSLIRMVNLAEKLADMCDKRKIRKKDKVCRPAIAVLKMFIKRLEAANRRCDGKKPQLCDEDKDWDDFDKEHRKDHDFDGFFREWDRDEWHKHKKQCKRFVGDEALKIITEDVQWLIKSMGGEIDKDHGKGADRNNNRNGKADKKGNH
jgi:hypothetical protein